MSHSFRALLLVLSVLVFIFPNTAHAGPSGLQAQKSQMLNLGEGSFFLPKFSVTANYSPLSRSRMSFEWFDQELIPQKQNSFSLNARFYNELMVTSRIGIRREHYKLLQSHSAQDDERTDVDLLLGLEYSFEMGNFYLYPAVTYALPLSSKNPSNMQYAGSNDAFKVAKHLDMALGLYYVAAQSIIFGIEAESNLSNFSTGVHDLIYFRDLDVLEDFDYRINLFAGFCLHR